MQLGSCCSPTYIRTYTVTYCIYCTACTPYLCHTIWKPIKLRMAGRRNGEQEIQLFLCWQKEECFKRNPLGTKFFVWQQDVLCPSQHSIHLRKCSAVAWVPITAMLCSNFYWAFQPHQGESTHWLCTCLMCYSLLIDLSTVAPQLMVLHHTLHTACNPVIRVLEPWSLAWHVTTPNTR